MSKEKEKEKRTEWLPKIRVSESELKQIHAKKEAAGVSLSDYVRYATLHGRIESKHDKALLVELHKMRGDLARLGNLFKLAFSEGFKNAGSLPKQIEDQLRAVRGVIERF